MPSWKVVAAVSGLGFLAVIVMCVIVYARTPIPSAQAGVKAQGSLVYWGNNSKPMLRLGEPRENIKLQQVPPNVRNAVLAAEDRNFYTEPGVSPRGIAGALYRAATGGEVAGGSTITQQLARNYFEGLSQDRTVSRKFKEIFISIRVGNERDKNWILENYLNTIYFGRNANGIQAASRAYFHKTVNQLNVSQGALLAAMIQQPTYFHTTGDPATDPARKAAEDRWNYVLDGMVEKGWLSSADRAKQRFPETQESWSFTASNSQELYIRAQLERELKQLGITGDMINSRGYKITTSLNQNLMNAAAKAVKEAGPGRLPKNVRLGLVSVNPVNGEIPAFYAGDGKKQADTVFFEAPQVGSSFKPYVLATALKQGYNTKSMIDGHSPQAFDFQGKSVPINTQDAYKVSNDDGDPPMGVIDLIRATQLSVNTAYVKLGLELGLPEVIQTAEQFGIPKPAVEPHSQRAGLSLGIANYPAVYQASGYAAFANGGTPVTPHIITSVKRADGSKVQLPSAWTKRKPRVLTEEQAAQATQAMQAVVKGGTGKRAALPDRPVAGKTGTTEKSAAAWFVGYVPQLSTAVTMFDRKNQPITSIPGYGSGVYGGQIPAQIWQNFMLRATHNMPVKQFTPPTFTEGTRQLWDSPRPSPTPTPKVPDCRGQRRFTDPACQDQNPNPNPTDNCGGFFQPKCPDPTTEPTQSPGGGDSGGGGQCPITDPNCRKNNNDDPATTQSRSLTPARTEE